MFNLLQKKNTRAEWEKSIVQYYELKKKYKNNKGVPLS